MEEGLSGGLVRGQGEGGGGELSGCDGGDEEEGLGGPAASLCVCSICSSTAEAMDANQGNPQC